MDGLISSIMNGKSSPLMGSDYKLCTFVWIDLSVKRKIEKHREKVLRCDSVLQKNPFVQAVPSSTLKKPKRKQMRVSKASDATLVEVGSLYNEYRNGHKIFFEILLLSLCAYLFYCWHISGWFSYGWHLGWQRFVLC